MRQSFIVLAAMALAVSCQEINEINEPKPITFSATILNDTEGTKAPFELTVPTSENPLTAAIWASTTSKSYAGSQKDEPEAGTNVIDYHNSTCFTSGTKQLLDHQLFYPANKADVYFVGFCPRSESGWSVEGAANNIARYQFDGKTDVMFASETSNSIEFSAIDLDLKFRHLLTWIKFKVVADKDAIEAWGNVKKITISSNNVVKINISDETCAFSQNQEQFPTYVTHKGIYTDTEFQNQSIELTTSPQEVAYTMCAAVNAEAGDTDNEYSITIETQYRPETTVPINLKAKNGSNFSGLTEGKQFTVTLHFKLGDNVTTSACVSEWTNGGIGVTPITE